MWCEVDIWWWLVFACILLSGIFGGLTRYFLDRVLDEPEPPATGSNGDRKQAERSGTCAAVIGNIIVGVAGAFLVPLFLNSISSTLLETSTTEPHHVKLFNLIGFCVAASVFAKQFIPTVSAKALRIAGEARRGVSEVRKTAEEAKTAAEVAKHEADDAVGLAQKVGDRALNVVAPIQAIESGNYDMAITELDRIVKFDPGNAEAYAWLAYCYKRKLDMAKAVEAISAAISKSEKPIFNWIYNLACYKSLSGAGSDEVVAVLKNAASVASAEQRAALKNDLKEEADFASLRGQSAKFDEFLGSL